jgi:hypothetical protein
VGGVFAVVGPVVLIIGVVRALTRPFRIPAPHLHPHVTGFGLLSAGLMMAVLIFTWVSRPGDRNPWRRAWSQGGVARIGAVILVPSTLLMLVGSAANLPQLFLGGWAVGAVGTVIMLASTKQRRV